MIEMKVFRRCDRCNVDMGEVEGAPSGEVNPVFTMKMDGKETIAFHDLCDPCTERLASLHDQSNKTQRVARRRKAEEVEPSAPVVMQLDENVQLAADPQ